jgi:hypothetical protein
MYGVAARNIARWDGTTWHPLGSGTDASVYALGVYDGELFVGGGFWTAGSISTIGIARWDGSEWSEVGSGVDGFVQGLQVYGSDLIVGGYFDSAGTVEVNNIASWNGSTWQSLGSGVGAGTSVKDMAVFEDSILIVGGTFTTAGGVSANRIARWNGTSWQAMGSGLWNTVFEVEVYNGEIVTGGYFSSSYYGIYFIAKWNGSTWVSVGTGMGYSVEAATIFQDSLLIAGGSFTTAGGVSASKVAQWNGSTWQAMGSGASNNVNILYSFGDSLLIAGGWFGAAGGVHADLIAHWNGTSWSALRSERELPLDLIVDDIDKDSTERDEIIYTAGNGGPVITQYVSMFGFDANDLMPCNKGWWDLVNGIGANSDIHGSRRTMAVGDVRGEGQTDLSLLFANRDTTTMALYGLYSDSDIVCTMDSVTTVAMYEDTSDQLTELVTADLDTGTITVGPPMFYRKTDMLQPLVVLNAPPSHYDVIDDTTWDVNLRYPWPPGPPAGYDTYSTYKNQQSWTVSMETESRRDWGISTGIKTYASAAGATLKAHLNAEYGEGFSKKAGSSETITLSFEVDARDDDQVYALQVDYDILEYPVYRGGALLGHIAVVTPNNGANVWSPGKSGERSDWIPDHETENVLSYRSLASLDDNPMMASTPIKSQTVFTLQGAQTSSWNLVQSKFTSSEVEQSWNVGLEVGASVGYDGGFSFFGVGFKWGVEVSVEASYDQSEINTYTSTFTSADSLHVDFGYINSAGSFSQNRQYRVAPYAYWAKNGALVLDYAVSPVAGGDVGEETWWQNHYSTPDPAFILPWRLDPEKWGTADNELRFKTKEIVFLPAEPSPGDSVRIIARVHNFSLSPTSGPVDVSFYLGDPDMGGTILSDMNSGDSVFQACDEYGAPVSIAGQGAAAAAMTWQVPAVGGISSCQRVWAVIDPSDTHSPEVHDNDDPITNNKGWKLLYVDTNEDCIDTDGDGYSDPAFICNNCPGGQLDNCPTIPNPDQSYNPCLSCCSGITGNVDDDAGGLVDIGDLTALIAYLYIPPNPEPICTQEANIDGDGEGLVDIGDLTALIAYLYIPPNATPAACQ